MDNTALIKDKQGKIESLTAILKSSGSLNKTKKAAMQAEIDKLKAEVEDLKKAPVV